MPERPLEADLGPVLSDRRGELARLPSLRRAPNARRHPLALRPARERNTEQGPDEDAVRKVGPREPKPLACCGNREQDAFAPREQAGAGLVRVPRIPLRRAARPLGAIDDLGRVRHEPGRAESAPLVRERMEGRERRAPATQSPARDARARDEGGREEAPEPGRAPVLRSEGRRERNCGSFGGREVLQREAEVVGRVETFLGTLLEAVVNDQLDSGRDGPARAFHLRRLVAQDRGESVSRTVAGEGAPGREHLVQHHAEAEDVGAHVHGLAADLLGAHVAERAEDHPVIGPVAGGKRRGRRERLRARARCVHLFREAEVEDLEAAFLRDPEVLGLQVAMDNTFLVGRREALGHLDRELRRLAGRQGAALEPRAQRLALEELHHDVERLSLRREIVDAEDVRMVQRGHGLGLALESGQRVAVLREVLGQHLHRHETIQPGVLGLKDLAHPARTERREDLVGTETGAGGKCHEVDGSYPGRRFTGIHPASHSSPPRTPEASAVRPAWREAPRLRRWPRAERGARPVAVQASGSAWAPPPAPGRNRSESTPSWW